MAETHDVVSLFEPLDEHPHPGARMVAPAPSLPDGAKEFFDQGEEGSYPGGPQTIPRAASAPDEVLAPTLPLDEGRRGRFVRPVAGIVGVLGVGCLVLVAYKAVEHYTSVRPTDTWGKGLAPSAFAAAVALEDSTPPAKPAPPPKDLPAGDAVSESKPAPPPASADAVTREGGVPHHVRCQANREGDDNEVTTEGDEHLGHGLRETPRDREAHDHDHHHDVAQAQALRATLGARWFVLAESGHE